jgi:two-component system sensor histidine kinase YesM
MKHIIDILTKIKKHRTENVFYSVKSLIVWLFIPIITIITLTVGSFSYALARRQLETHAYINITDTVSQTKNYLDNRLHDIFEQLVVLADDSDLLSVMSRVSNDQLWRLQDRDYIRLSENINKVYIAYYSSLKSVLVYLNDGRVVLYKSDNLFYGVNFDFRQWRERFYGNPSDYYWLNLHPDRIFKGDPARVASLFRIIGQADSAARGMILFNLRESFFQKILSDPVISSNGYLALISNDGSLVSKPVGRPYRLDHELVAQIRKLPQQSGNFKYQKPFGPKMVVVYNTLNTCQWKLMAVLPENDILSKTAYIKSFILLLSLILLLVAVLLSNVLANIITRPLSRLTKKVKSVTEGDMDVPFDLTVSNEIGVLNNGIGALIVRIKSLVAQIKAEQEQKRIADLAILQAQINPHFLYNTIYSIQQLCALGETQNASKMLLALGNFFRIGLSQGQEIITIGEEIEHVRNYLLIQGMKYADQLQYDIVIEPAILDANIIKLTLQPLVENAIYHGVKKRPNRGIIQIKGYRDGQLIRLEVRDNGVGMAEAQLAQIRAYLAGGGEHPKMNGFGLYNVHERLKIHFGINYGLTIESQENVGTVVTVTIPAPLKNDILQSGD